MGENLYFSLGQLKYGVWLSTHIFYLLPLSPRIYLFVEFLNALLAFCLSCKLVVFFFFKFLVTLLSTAVVFSFSKVLHSQWSLCVRGLGWRFQARERDYVTLDYSSIVQIPSLDHSWIFLAWRILRSLSSKLFLLCLQYSSFLLFWPRHLFNLAHHPTAHILSVHFLCKSRIIISISLLAHSGLTMWATKFWHQTVCLSKNFTNQ